MAKTFPASLDHLSEMLVFIKNEAENAGFNDVEVVKIELAVEEALVNIINYGYPDLAGCITISCNMTPKGSLQVVIKDNGIPFNPLTNPRAFSLENFSDETKDGGYGIFLILKIMDEVKYEWLDNSNILTLQKFKSKLNG